MHPCFHFRLYTSRDLLLLAVLAYFSPFFESLNRSIIRIDRQTNGKTRPFVKSLLNAHDCKLVKHERAMTIWSDFNSVILEKGQK